MDLDVHSWWPQSYNVQIDVDIDMGIGASTGMGGDIDTLEDRALLRWLREAREGFYADGGATAAGCGPGLRWNGGSFRTPRNIFALILLLLGTSPEHTACGFGCFLTASRVWLQWTHFGRVSIDDLSVGDIFGSLRQYRGSLIYRYFLQWPVSTDNQRYVVHAGWWFARLTSHVEDDSAGFGEHARPSEDELT
ncbi:hypothetical protein BDP27DRAFT_1411429 [Rhodocollybia butyracea]|uniref:Uncharacterized protein n=1 Tax=Rhodocollybia butyracea TaxID=206335 RepID=A0A9P5P4F3_9AGAR|nr:hypothetical protein BDP27DRAFT_1411429 [Rhodocollybia butyracea]